MSAIRIVWGTATGPTEMAAYDAALAEANVHDYNLVTVSSVIPADPPVEAVGTAPDLGPTGQRLTVVQGHETAPPDDAETVVAGLGWARSDSGRGIFYEGGGTDPDAVRERIRDGLAHGKELRDWEFVDREILIREEAVDDSDYTTAVICAVYGESTPII